MTTTRGGACRARRLRLAACGRPVAPSAALAGKRVTWLAGPDPRPRFVAGKLGALPVLEAVVPPVRIGARALSGDAGSGDAGSGVAGPTGRRLVLHLAGRGCYRTAGVTVDQAPGDAVVLAAGEPVEVVHPDGAHVVALALPDAPSPPAPPPVQRLGGAPGRLAAGVVEMLIEAAPGLGAGLQAGLVHHVVGLVELAVADAALAARDPRARRRQAVFGWLDANLAEPDLSAEQAAAGLGLSRRRLHALLQDSGTGFKAYVTRRRLELCRARLEDPALAHRSVTAIALASGFNDLSTFYRQFRRHYRTTPTAVRRAALAPGSPRLPALTTIG